MEMRDWYWTYPRTGPRKGATMKRHTDKLRWAGGYRSAIVPAPILSGGEPKTPEKKRQITRPAKVLEKPAPMVRSPKTGRHEKYTARRPSVSLKGAAIIGPKAVPST